MVSMSMVDGPMCCMDSSPLATLRSTSAKFVPDTRALVKYVPLRFALLRFAHIRFDSVRFAPLTKGLPPRDDDAEPVFSPDEIVLTLHDETEEGRLFRMNSW